jgi:quercetin dioxygenase-like cupin family protein
MLIEAVRINGEPSISTASGRPAMRAAIVALSVLLAAGASALVPNSALAADADPFPWKAGPPSLPKGAQMAVVSGDPAKKGPLVVRLKLPGNYIIPPHRQPMAENITVLYGVLNVGMGERLDKTRIKPYERGDHLSIPANTPHYVQIFRETIIQLNGTGPFAVEYVNPANDPRKPPAQ